MLDLKYLFHAVFADGKEITQPEDNISRLRPEFDENGWRPSAFYDVQEYEKKSQLLLFSLIGEGHRYSVDLRDGRFSIDGLRFQAHSPELHIWSTPENPLRLIYYRQMHRNSDVEFTADKDGEFKPTSSIDHDPVIKGYVIGWQTNTDKGENIQQTIIVS